MSKAFQYLVAALICAAAIAGCSRRSETPQAGSQSSGSSAMSSDAAGAAERSGRAVDDSVITTKVKTALLTDANVKGTDIMVETNHGEVLLSGAVATRDQADRAAKIASSIDGVKGVNNKLAVR